MDANRIAAQATELAAKLGLKVDQLPAFVHQKQIELNALAASMTKSSDQLNDARKAAEAAQANAEIALGTLRREAQGRSLSDKQSAYLTSVLRDKDLPKILVQSESGDTESYPYAMQILSAIKKAGRTAEYQTWPSVFMWFNEPGVFIVSNAHVKKQHTAALIDALNGSGVKVEEAQTSEDTALRDPRPEIISIVVWKKPLPKRP